MGASRRSPVRTRLVLGAGVVSAVAALTLPSAAVAPPTAADRSAVAVTAQQLAAGQADQAARTICANRLWASAEDLGQALARADLTVMDMGGTVEQISRFTAAVNASYARAAVPRENAAASFGIGLGYIVSGYADQPRGLMGFWGGQAGIGTNILARAAQEWTASAGDGAPCARFR